MPLPNPLPDPNLLCEQLAQQIRPDLRPDTAFIGIYTGGAWLASRLHALLGGRHELGFLDVAFYRDDYAARGLHAKPKRSEIRFDIDHRPIILVDDILYTGRTTRAALNELFDYGRPAQVDLATLIDRGGRQLPIYPRYCAYTLDQALPADKLLRLTQNDDGTLSVRMTDA